MCKKQGKAIDENISSYVRGTPANRPRRTGVPRHTVWETLCQTVTSLYENPNISDTVGVFKATS